MRLRTPRVLNRRRKSGGTLKTTQSTRCCRRLTSSPWREPAQATGLCYKVRKTLTGRCSVGLPRALPVLLLALFAGLAIQSFAQSITSGDVTGIVTDPSGAVLPNAAVTLTTIGTNTVQKSATNGEGTYRFAFVAPGAYRLTVAATGFQTQERTGLSVAPGQPTAANVQLTIASAAQSVDLVEGATVLQTENADDTTSFSAEMIQDLPNPGGDLTYIAQTVAGVVMATQSGYGNFEANGMPATSNLFTVNGGNVNDVFLSLNNAGASNLTLGGNDIAEASVINNAYSAQYGQYSGTQVSYISKSGSNQFHGDAVYMWNGRTLNANQFFSNEVGAPRPFNNFNQWATNIQGPIKKNKTFFDFDYEGLRNVLPTAANLTLIPSPQFQTATLANLAAVGNAAEIPFYKQVFAVYNGSSGSAGAVPVPGGGCNGIVSNLLVAGAPCALQFRTTPPNENREDNWAIRIDRVFGEKDRGYVRFWRDNGFQPSFTSPFGATFDAQSNQPQFTAVASESHTFGPNTVNQLNANSLFYAAVFVPSDPAGAAAALPTFLKFSDGSFTYAGAGAAFGGFFDFPQGRRVFQTQLADDISHVAGKHTFRGGFNYLHDNITDLSFEENVLGQVTTNIQDFFNGGGPGTSLNRAFPTSPEHGYKLAIFGAYAADDWKVSDRLTVSLNLRLEHYSDPTCNDNCFSQLSTQFNGIAVNSANTPYNQLIHSGQKNAYASTQAVVWEPRIGIAWKPFNDDRTVIRTGAGIFSDPITGGLSDYAALNPPGNVNFVVGDGNIAPGVPGSLFTLAAQSNQAFQSQFKSGGSLNSISNSVLAFGPPSFTSFPGDFKNPQYYKWNVEVQHTFGIKTVVSANYSGMHGIRIPVPDGGMNAYCPVSVCPNGFPGLPASAPNPAFGTVVQYISAGVASYNGLQLSVQQRVAAGLTFNVNYTWSHALDDISNGGQNEPFNDLSTDGSITFANNPFNLAKQYGNSDYDVHHYFSAGLVLNDAIRHAGLKGGPNQIFGGWTVSGNIFWRSGMPFTVIDNSASGALAGFNYLGTILASPTRAISANCGNAVNAPCLTPSEFVPPAGATGVLTGFGTIGRNMLFGPHFFDIDLSIMKSVKIGEHLGFQFGFQAYNALNHTNFDQPVNDISNPNFGSSIAAVGPPTSLLGSFVGAGSSPRFVEIKGTLRF